VSFFDYRYVPGVEADSFIDTIRAYVAEHVEPA